MLQFSLMVWSCIKEGSELFSKKDLMQLCCVTVTALLGQR